LELMFLLAFTLHNIEEGIWLPRWSKYAGKYHPQVKNNEFHFALIVVTTAGYILTFLFLVFGQSVEIIKYLYLGFLSMMCLNAIFPHFIATILLKRYAPGTLTGLLLNLPIGMTIVLNHMKAGIQLDKLIFSIIIVTILIVASLRPLFRIGSKLIDQY
jgi:hypothetical protein